MSSSKSMFKTKKTSDIVDPSFFGGIKGYSSDTLDDGTQKEYVMYNVFCDIYKFRNDILPHLEKPHIPKIVSDGFKQTVSDIIHDAEHPETIEEYFDFVRFGIILPKAWETGTFTSGDRIMFVIDLMEITKDELRKVRINDEVDRNVMFYYLFDPKAVQPLFESPAFNEENLDKLEWAPLIEEMLTKHEFSPVKNNDAAELIKIDRYNKIDKVNRATMGESIED